MTIGGFLFGVALLAVIGGRVLIQYITSDPCEGSGNFRNNEYYGNSDCDDDDTESTKKELTNEVAKLSKKINYLNKER